MFRQLIISLINLYQKTLSPDHGPLKVFGGTCRFQPTCSEYTKQAVGHFGVLKGLALGAKRVGRCHPLTAGGYDPVPTAPKKPVATSPSTKLGVNQLPVANPSS